MKTAYLELILFQWVLLTKALGVMWHHEAER